MMAENYVVIPRNFLIITGADGGGEPDNIFRTNDVTTSTPSLEGYSFNELLTKNRKKADECRSD